MTRFILTLAIAFGIATITTNAAFARGNSNRNSGGHSHATSNHSQHTMTSHNHSGHGQMHNGHSSFRHRGSNWGSRRWNSRYGCWTWYSPSNGLSYYWCAPYGSYFPVGYAPTGSYAYDTPNDDGDSE